MSERNPAHARPDTMFTNDFAAQTRKLRFGDTLLYETTTPVSEVPATTNFARRAIELWNDVTQNISLALSDPERFWNRQEDQRKQSPIENDKTADWLYETYKGRRALDGILGLGPHDNRNRMSLLVTVHALRNFTGPEGEIFDATIAAYRQEDWKAVVGTKAYARIHQILEKKFDVGPENEQVDVIMREMILKPALDMYYFTHPTQRADLAKRMQLKIRLPFPGDTYDFGHKDARDMSLHETLVAFLDRSLTPDREIDHTRAGAIQRLKDFFRDEPFAFTVKGIRKERIKEIHEALREFKPSYEQTHGILVNAKMAGPPKE